MRLIHTFSLPGQFATIRSQAPNRTLANSLPVTFALRTEMAWGPWNFRSQEYSLPWKISSLELSFPVDIDLRHSPRLYSVLCLYSNDIFCSWCRIARLYVVMCHINVLITRNLSLLCLLFICVLSCRPTARGGRNRKNLVSVLQKIEHRVGLRFTFVE